MLFPAKMLSQNVPECFLKEEAVEGEPKLLPQARDPGRWLSRVVLGLSRPGLTPVQRRPGALCCYGEWPLARHS